MTDETRNLIDSKALSDWMLAEAEAKLAEAVKQYDRADRYVRLSLAILRGLAAVAVTVFLIIIASVVMVLL